MRLNFIKNFFRSKRQNNLVSYGDNIVASIARCKALYKKLIIAAHPDKHPSQIDLAEELTKAINRARYDYSELIKLEKRVDSELQ